MGIYESLNERNGRSAGSMEAIANTIAQVRKQKQVEENTKRLRTLLMGNNSDQSSVINDQQPLNTTTPDQPGTSVPDVTQSLLNARNNTTQQNTGMRGLQDMNADEIMGMGDILRETPELSPQVEMLQKAVAARRPELFNLNQGEGRYSFDRTTGKVVPLVVNPARQTPAKMDKGNYMRGGKFVHDVFQDGDTPYEKSPTDKQQWITRGGKLVFDVPGEGDMPYEKPQREPIPNEETVRHNTETERMTRQKEQLDLQQKDHTRVTELTDKNKDLTTQMSLMQQETDPKGSPKYSQKTIDQVQKNIQDNQDEIARIHMKNGGKYVTLRVAREYYKGLDPNAPELKLDDAQLQAALEKAGYDVGN